MSLSASQEHAHAAGLGYRPALDGIRAVAIACVVLNHTFGFPATGFTGVDVFFVLSGFLITTLLLDEYALAGPVSLPDFYRRRALRLLPALFVLLGVFLAFSFCSAVVRGGSLDEALFGVAAGIGYFSNIAMAAEPSSLEMPNALRHLWSLAIEEQFYLLWPPILFLLLRARLRLAMVVLAAGIVLSAAQQVRLTLDGASDARVAFGTDTRITSILIGCMLAALLATAARARVESLGKTLAPLVLSCFLALLFIAPDLTFFTPWVLLLGLSAAGLILRALDGSSLLAKALSLRPMVFLGRISYSLYLWHIPVYVALGVGTTAELMDIPALGLALACAIASYYLVELPFLRRKRRARASNEAEAAAPAIPALSPIGS
jgi:peptidoglycan/LPS O-acetylase OafA/YrhL